MHDLTAQERAGLIAWLLAFGARLTIKEIMQLTGLNQRGAYYLISRISRVTPIICDDGKWCKVEWCKMEIGENGK